VNAIEAETFMRLAAALAPLFDDGDDETPGWEGVANALLESSRAARMVPGMADDESLHLARHAHYVHLLTTTEHGVRNVAFDEVSRRLPATVAILARFDKLSTAMIKALDRKLSHNQGPTT
jgi:hypothetical protein